VNVGTTAQVFFDSRLTLADLPGMPARLLAECPAVAERLDHFATPFEWWSSASTERRSTPPGSWSPLEPARLFSPIGFLVFRSGSLEWDSFIKYPWLRELPSRAWLSHTASQLAKVVGATLAFIAPDYGAQDLCLDILEANGTVGDAIAAAAREGKSPRPLDQDPFVKAVYYTLRFT
jgi:hypothetical protein